MLCIAKEKKINSVKLLPFSLKISHLQPCKAVRLHGMYIHFFQGYLTIFSGNEVQVTNADTCSRSTTASRGQVEKDTHLFVTFNKRTEITGKAILEHFVSCKFEKIAFVSFIKFQKKCNSAYLN